MQRTAAPPQPPTTERQHFWKRNWHHALTFSVVTCVVLTTIAFYISTTDTIIVGPFTVPRDYEERGYTSEAMSSAVMQYIHGNQSTVSFNQQPADEPSIDDGLTGDSFESLSSHIDGKHVVSSFEPSNIPDVSVPDTSFTLRTLIDLLRETVGRRPTRIAGEIVNLSPGDAAIVGQRDPQHIQVLIRYKIEFPEPSYSILGYHWWPRRTTTVSNTLRADGAEAVIRKLALITADGLGRRTLPHEDSEHYVRRLISRGNAFFGLEDYDRAEDMYRLAKKQNLSKQRGHILLCLGAIEEHKGNYPQARLYYENATKAPHDNDDDDALWASLYQGNLLWHARKFPEAEAKYRYITELPGPRSLLVQAAAQNNLGFVYLFQGNWPRADYAFRLANDRAAQLHEDDWACAYSSNEGTSCDKAAASLDLDVTRQLMARIHYGRARTWAKINPASVKPEYQEAVQSDPAYSSAHYELALLYIADHHYKKGIDELQKTIHYEPGFEPAYSRWQNLIDHWSTLPGKQKSDKPMKRALASAYKTWGDEFSHDGDPDEAADKYCKAGRLDSEYNALCKGQTSDQLLSQR